MGLRKVAPQPSSESEDDDVPLPPKRKTGLPAFRRSQPVQPQPSKPKSPSPPKSRSRSRSRSNSPSSDSSRASSKASISSKESSAADNNSSSKSSSGSEDNASSASKKSARSASPPASPASASSAASLSSASAPASGAAKSPSSPSSVSSASSAPPPLPAKQASARASNRHAQLAKSQESAKAPHSLTMRQRDMVDEYAGKKSFVVTTQEELTGLRGGRKPQEDADTKEWKQKERARKRKEQQDRALEQEHADTIRRILSKDGGKKARKGTKDAVEETLARRAQHQQAVALNCFRFVDRCARDGEGDSARVVEVSFPVGLEPFASLPPDTPKPAIRCGASGCTNSKKFCCARTQTPLCSFECYKALHQQST